MSHLRMMSGENQPDRPTPPVIDSPTGAPGPAFPQGLPSPSPDAPNPIPPIPSAPYPPVPTIPPIVTAYPATFLRQHPWLLPVGGTALGFLAGLFIGLSIGRKRRTTF